MKSGNTIGTLNITYLTNCWGNDNEVEGLLLSKPPAQVQEPVNDPAWELQKEFQNDLQ